MNVERSYRIANFMNMAVAVSPLEVEYSCLELSTSFLYNKPFTIEMCGFAYRKILVRQNAFSKLFCIIRVRMTKTAELAPRRETSIVGDPVRLYLPTTIQHETRVRLAVVEG